MRGGRTSERSERREKLSPLTNPKKQEGCVSNKQDGAGNPKGGRVKF